MSRQDVATHTRDVTLGVRPRPAGTPGRVPYGRDVTLGTRACHSGAPSSANADQSRGTLYHLPEFTEELECKKKPSRSVCDFRRPLVEILVMALWLHHIRRFCG